MSQTFASIEELDAILGQAVLSLREEYLQTGILRAQLSVNRVKKNLLKAISERRTRKLDEIGTARKTINEKIFAIKKSNFIPKRRKFADADVPGAVEVNERLRELYKSLGATSNQSNTIRRRNNVSSDNFYFFESNAYENDLEQLFTIRSKAEVLSMDTFIIGATNSLEAIFKQATEKHKSLQCSISIDYTMRKIIDASGYEGETKDVLLNYY